MHATFIFLQSWSDEKLKWDPNDYNGLKTLRMPCKSLWLPDIVLYNRFVANSKIFNEILHLIFLIYSFISITGCNKKKFLSRNQLTRIFRGKIIDLFDLDTTRLVCILLDYCLCNYRYSMST